MIKSAIKAMSYRFKSSLGTRDNLMKVVHVMSSLVRKSAGVREVVLKLAGAQQRLGVDVAVLGLDHPDWADEKNDWDNIPTKVSSVCGPRAFGFAPLMTKTLQEMEPDIVHLHGLWMYPGWSVLQWHRKTARPYIVSPHGMLSDVALSYSPLKKRVVSLLFQDEIFKKAASIHVTCDAEVKEVRNYGIRANSHVIPNGISEISLPKQEMLSGKTVLSLGRIHQKKALDQLVIAWGELENEFPDWNLKIIGPDEGGEAARLIRLADTKRLKRVSVQGPVYGAEKYKVMASAGIFALPTRSENFALTVAESLMLSVPVVSSHGAPWEGLEIEKCGRWVPFGAKPMAEALRDLMSLTGEERKVMGERGRNWMIRDFSWPTIAKRSEKYYENVLNRYDS